MNLKLLLCSLMLWQTTLQEPALPTRPSQILESTAYGNGEKIKANPSQSWGHGYFIGRPLAIYTNADPSTETYLLAIHMEGPTKNAGKTVARIQAANVGIYHKFLTLVKNESYVFEYDHNIPIPFIDMVSRSVVGIYTTQEYLAKRQVESVPRVFVSGSKFVGSLGDGAQRGRVIDVQRIGRIGYSCTFAIETGEIGPSASSSKYFNVLDEQLCAHVEKIIALRYHVEVQYARDFIEAWQPSGYFAQSVKILDEREAEY